MPAKRATELAQWARRKLVPLAMAADPSSKQRARCASMCRARAAVVRASCGPHARRAEAKGGCGARKRLMCAFPRVWPMAGACGVPEKEMRETWALRQAVCICGEWGGRIQL